VSNLLNDATATMNELIRMHRLCQELLETLSVTMMWIKDYTKKHNIPLPNESSYSSLINRANTLIEEIASSDDFLHKKKSDKDFTEPRKAIYKGGV
jgi:hypothetical protein